MFEHSYSHALPGNIYFIQQGPEGPIKIGWTLDPKKRLREFQTANAHVLYLRGVISGSRGDEANVHGLFEEHRIRGEWFQPCQCIFNFLSGGEVPDRRINWGGTPPAFHNPLEVPALRDALVAPIGWGSGERTAWAMQGDEALERETEMPRFLLNVSPRPVRGSRTVVRKRAV